MGSHIYTFIFSNNYKEFSDYCTNNNIKFNPDMKVIHVESDCNQLLGISRNTHLYINLKGSELNDEDKYWIQIKGLKEIKSGL